MKQINRDKKTLVLEERKSVLILGLRDVRERILALASTIPKNQQDNVYVGNRSSREMLVHLAGWDETNIKAAHEILAGRLPSFYRDSGQDWATYNAKIVSKFIRDDYDELLSLVGDTHRNLLTVIEEIPAVELWKDRGIRASGWKVMIGRLLEAEMEDEEEHYHQLEKFVELGMKS